MTVVTSDGADAGQRPHLRRSILELAPLELDCMNALWSIGEGTVREIQRLMAATRPRAYTTIMTILDRLEQKGVVSRQKAGRAYLYRPQLSAEQARAHAVARIIDGFFAGSTQALVAQLAGVAAAKPLTAADVVTSPPAPADESDAALDATRL